MTKRWLNALFSDRPELRPARALLTPTWLGALAVLGLNDHLFKGGGVLPGALTGKLSDFAGMIVAPALLAALIGVRSRRGLALCTLAVGAVFSLINLSPAAADAWSWLMGLVGFPWAITVDPSDLLALPALALGWRALAPAMRREAPSFAALRRPLELGAAAAGTLLCVATSEPDPDGGEGGEFGEFGEFGEVGDSNGLGSYAPIFADVYLHNTSNEAQIVVRVRELREDILVDCFNTESDPGILFSEALFDEGVTWTLPPLTNAPVRQIGMHPDRDCYAILVQSDTLEPTVLFWKNSQIPATEVEGQHLSPDGYQSGAVLLAADADGVVSIAGSESDVVFPTSAPTPDAYLPRADSTRVAWSDPPLGSHQITGLDLGLDGCAAFTFDDGGPRFYLCTPLPQIPFEVGQYVSVSDYGDTVVLSRDADPNDPAPVPELQIAASRGDALPNLSDAVLAAKPNFVDHLGPDPICGTVAQPQEISVSFAGDVDTLEAGQTRTYDDGVHTLTLYSVRAERRLVLDPECAEGPDRLGDDLEIVAVWAESQP